MKKMKTQKHKNTKIINRQEKNNKYFILYFHIE